MGTNADDILKTHQEFLDRIQQHVDSLREGKGASPEVAIKLKEDLLEKRKQRLNEITAAKEEAIRRFDEEINGHRASVASLESEIGAAKAVETSEPQQPAQPAEPVKEPQPAEAEQAQAPKKAEQTKPSIQTKKAKSAKQLKPDSEQKPKQKRARRKAPKQRRKK